MFLSPCQRVRPQNEIMEERRGLAQDRAELAVLRRSTDEHCQREKAKSMGLQSEVDAALNNLRKDTAQLDDRSVSTSRMRARAGRAVLLRPARWLPL